jgi:hypothetical protein
VEKEKEGMDGWRKEREGRGGEVGASRVIEVGGRVLDDKPSRFC